MVILQNDNIPLAVWLQVVIFTFYLSGTKMTVNARQPLQQKSGKFNSQPYYLLQYEDKMLSRAAQSEKFSDSSPMSETKGRKSIIRKVSMRQVNFWKPENSNSVRVRIPYWFDTRHKWDNKMIESIKSVLYDIQAMACIEFYPLNKNWLFFKSSKSMATSAKDHPPGIHKNQTDLQTQKLAGFIHFLQQDGCWAMIGRQTLPKRHDKSAVSLGPSSENVDLDILKTLSAGLIQGTQVSLTFPECSHPGTVTHELLHVLGFAHEHDRADRDRFLYVHRKAIKPGFVQNFGLQPDYREGRYDPESILHYRADSFSRVRHVPVLEPLDSRSSTRWWHSGGCHRKKCSIYLSPGDIQKLQSRYGTC